MNRLQTMESVVFKVLDERPETRKDDYLLMLAVCEELTPEIIKCSFASVLYNHNFIGLPNWETVTRCRRKIQEKHPELKNIETAKKRMEEQEKYIEYART